jgi:hypothetical protein
MEAYTHDFVAQFPHLIQEGFLVLFPAGIKGTKPIQQSGSIVRHVLSLVKEAHKTVSPADEGVRNGPVRMALLEFQNAPSGEEELRTCR